MADGTRIRWRPDTEFELRCSACCEWWPLTTEFWTTFRGFRRCRACFAERRRTGERLRQAYVASPGAVERRRVRDNERKAAERRDPAKRPALLERQRETQRAYYERRKGDVLARRRAAYVERVGHEPRAGIGRPRVAA